MDFICRLEQELMNIRILQNHMLVSVVFAHSLDVMPLIGISVNLTNRYLDFCISYILIIFSFKINSFY